MPGTLLPRIIAAIGTVIPSPRVVTDGKRMQANGFIQICTRGKFHPSSRIPWDSHSPAMGDSWVPFLLHPLPLSILCPSFTLCRINYRSCWNKRKKEPLNKDHHLPPPQRRWTFSEKKCSWRDVFESSIPDRCSCLTMARKHQDTLPSKPHILITLGVRWVTKPWAENLQHKIWILISCSHVNWRKIGETWVKHVYTYCKWLSLKIKTTTNSSQDLYRMKPPKFQQRLGEKQIKLCP